MPRQTCLSPGTPTEFEPVVVLPEAQDLVGALRDAVAFIRGVLGVRLAWADGREDTPAVEMIRAAQEGRNIAAVGGHRTRKDYTLSAVDCWMALAWAPCTVICTAPKLEQATRIQIHYCEEILRGSRFLDGAYEVLGTRIRFPALGSEIVALTTSSKEETAISMSRFTGMHRRRLVLHVTEGPGIPNAIYQQLVSLGSGPDFRFFATGNAIWSPGHWFQKLFRDGPKGWSLFQWPSASSPYCAPEWIEERRREWGEESVLYRARVLGEFPERSAEVLISETWLLAAQEAMKVEAAPKVTAVGVDVGGSSEMADLTVIQKVKGFVAEEPLIVKGSEVTQQVQDELCEIMKENSLGAGQVRVDATGVGLGVVEGMTRRGYPVSGVHFGQSAVRKNDFLNARAEMYWNLRELLRGGHVRLPKDEKLYRDLSDIRFRMGGDKRTALEDKAQIQARNGYSPDRADALALALYGVFQEMSAERAGVRVFGPRALSQRDPFHAVRLARARLNGSVPRWLYR